MKNITKENNLGIKKLNRKLPILAQEKYLKIKSDNYGYLVDENFILPYFLDKRLIFVRMVFTYGLIAKKSDLTLDDEKKFLDTMVEFLKNQKLCDFIYKAQSNVIFNVCPKGADCVPWGSYITNIQKSDEDILNSFHGKHRNVIRKAIKDGVTIEETKDINIIYKIISDTMIRQNIIYYPSLEFLQGLSSKINSNVLFLKATKDGVTQGAGVFIYDHESSYYMYGGSIERPHIGSVNLLHYEAIKILKNRDVQKYDFVGARINFKTGSKYEGLDRFKKRFGGELNKGFAFRFVVNPIKFKLFNIISKIYLKLKGYNYIDPIDSIQGES